MKKTLLGCLIVLAICSPVAFSSNIQSKLVNLGGLITGTLNVPNGGTGDTSFTSNAVVVGNSTSQLAVVTNNSSATNEFLTQSSSGAPAWATILAADVPGLAASKITSGTLAVAQGGTNLASGTSGGILGYTATGTLASSALLTQYGVVYGGGAGSTPATTSADSNTAHFLAGGSPPFFSALPAASSSAAGTASFEATGTTSTTFTFNGSGGTSSSITLNYNRVSYTVTLSIPQATAESGTSSTYFASNTAIADSWALPKVVTWWPACIQDNNANISTFGVLQLNTSGVITFFESPTTTGTWGNSHSNSGPCTNLSVSYTVQ